MMRLKEWYGYHFPELTKLIEESITYVKVVKAIGNRENSANADLDDILPEDLIEEVIRASDMSMGTEISEQDEQYILGLTDQIIELDDYRR